MLCWRLKSKCKSCILLLVFVKYDNWCKVVIANSLSSNGGDVEKMHMLNKGIIHHHLIDESDILWHFGFKNESQADKVHIIVII